MHALQIVLLEMLLLLGSSRRDTPLSNVRNWIDFVKGKIGSWVASNSPNKHVLLRTGLDLLVMCAFLVTKQNEHIQDECAQILLQIAPDSSDTEVRGCACRIVYV
jgi:hypothetical protein